MNCAPLTLRLLGHLGPSGNRVVRLARGTGQHEGVATAERGWQQAAVQKRLQRRSLAITSRQLGLQPTLLIAASPLPRYRIDMQS